jgi:feruloyl-CoA synthase
MLVLPSADAAQYTDFAIRLKEQLAAFNASRSGTSARIARALVMTEPPSIDAGEITDKGYLNQRAILERRAGLVERLYAHGSTDVLRP